MTSRRSLYITLQLLAVGIVLAFLGWALRDAWREAAPRLRDADVSDLCVAMLLLSAYYLLFVIGWKWILAALEVEVPYGVALQSEMFSMLAKYVPGGVWVPAARVVALRRFGFKDTPPVLGSIAFEAGLSAVSGVLVFAVGLTLVEDVDVPLLPLVAFALVIAVLLHPRVFRPLSRRLLRPFGASDLPTVPYRTLGTLLGFYCFTWLVGGAALLFLVRSVGGEAGLAEIPFLGGTAAVGAIVSVLAFFMPSGLGVREASMYGLMLAVTTSGVALGATVLNRIAITLVEAVLLLAGGLAAAVRKP